MESWPDVAAKFGRCHTNFAADGSAEMMTAIGPGHKNVCCSRQRRTKWSCPPGLGRAPREDRSDAVAGGCCLSTLCLLSRRIWNHRAQRRPRSLDVGLGRVSGARQDTVVAVSAFYQTPLAAILSLMLTSVVASIKPPFTCQQCWK